MLQKRIIRHRRLDLENIDGRPCNSAGFDTIKVAVDYDGSGEPLYKEFPGWQEEVEGITELKKLPKNCRAYIDFIEEEVGVPIGMISTGPKRSDIIFREELF